jgi:hypothetical protein
MIHRRNGRITSLQYQAYSYTDKRGRRKKRRTQWDHAVGEEFFPDIWKEKGPVWEQKGESDVPEHLHPWVMYNYYRGRNNETPVDLTMPQRRYNSCCNMIPGYVFWSKVLCTIRANPKWDKGKIDRHLLRQIMLEETGQTFHNYGGREAEDEEDYKPPNLKANYRQLQWPMLTLHPPLRWVPYCGTDRAKMPQQQGPRFGSQEAGEVDDWAFIRRDYKPLSTEKKAEIENKRLLERQRAANRGEDIDLDDAFVDDFGDDSSSDGDIPLRRVLTVGQEVSVVGPWPDDAEPPQAEPIAPQGPLPETIFWNLVLLPEHLALSDAEKMEALKAIRRAETKKSASQSWRDHRNPDARDPFNGDLCYGCGEARHFSRTMKDAV